MRKIIFQLIALLALATSVHAMCAVRGVDGKLTNVGNLSTANSATTLAGKEVVVVSPEPLASNMTWRADAKLTIAKGGYIQFSNGAVLTVLSPFEGARHLMFKGNGYPAFKNIDYVTPEMFGALGGVNTTGTQGLSKPLSNYYSTLAAAQVDYPFVSALTDELDWAGFQACLNALSKNQQSATTNFSSGAIKLSRTVYMVNYGLVGHVYQLSIEGTMAGWNAIASGSSIQYNGTAGTKDANKWILDNWCYNELGNPPSGYLPQSNGISLNVTRVGFYGIDTSATRNYVSGIRLRNSLNSRIAYNNFGGLYDGVSMTGQQLFTIIEHNSFYGTYRDSVSSSWQTLTYSTTIHVEHNYFGLYGRYAIMLYGGGSGTSNVIRDNDFEGEYNSYYFQHPAEFYLGIPASVLLAGTTSDKFMENRFENATYLHGLMLANTAWTHINQNEFVGPAVNGAWLAFTEHGLANSAATTFLAANGYMDLTAERNFTFTGATSQVSSLFIDQNVSYQSPYFAFEYGALTLGGYNSLIDSPSIMYTVPIVAGAPVIASKTLLDTSVLITTLNVQGGQGSNIALRNLNVTNATVTTSAPSAGGAGALPATPLGYFTMTINGTARQVPCY